ncbi:hypothetical protein VB620_09265 [Nodularia harveyana UHCC-0300]|uniref:ApeA N-terminal domain-containing protein n=1 Tax=Nodularia harveyana UHCC-0300 TaxID=2974287 RepID=A0ABU5UDD0_9CYAN|nr:hypothetical protein [Nodularia harveyana]MEA5581528.1 hypothetical protein [Nodularia harveyana UHCC-0300]
MKVKYKFRVTGKLKPSAVYPIRIRGNTYELETNENGIVTYIVVSQKIDSPNLYPQVTQNPVPGVKLSLQISSLPLSLIQKELKVIEGLLSIYGLESIELTYPKTQWIAETEEDHQHLKIFKFKESISKIDDAQIPHIPFDLIARSFIGAVNGFDIEIPLSFFRKGRIDFCEHRYIEAIYDFYFLIETLYADGKYDTSGVLKKFESSNDLIEAIQKVIDNPEQMFITEKQQVLEFNKNYQGKSMREILKRIVELRGFLHHHTLKRKDIWHPEDHNRYETDAYFLQAVAFNIVIDLSHCCVFSQEVVEEYKKSFLNK